MTVPFPPASHRGDPATSRLAEHAVTESGARASQIDRIAEAVWTHPGRTSSELAAITGLDRYQAARRCPDALAQGRIKQGPARVCTVQGRLCVTWWPAAPEDGTQLPLV